MGLLQIWFYLQMYHNHILHHQTCRHLRTNSQDLDAMTTIILQNLIGIIMSFWESKKGMAGAGMAALAIEYELPRKFLTAERPIRVSLSADSKWKKGEADTYRGQFKVAMPVPKLTGVEIPISLTVANRSELIDEKTEIRGLVGFTIDTSRLFSAFSNAGGLFAGLVP